MRAVEMHYTIDEAALLLRLHRKTVIERLLRGDYGREVNNQGTEQRPDYRIPASGLNADLARRRVFLESTDLGIPARSPGELRRKVRTRRGRFLAGET